MKQQNQKRVMFRFGQKAHALAKPIAALNGMSIQDYIDHLITKDAELNHPEVIDELEKKDIKNNLKSIADKKGMTVEELVDFISAKCKK